MGIEPLQSSGSVVRYSTYPKYWVEKERRETFHSQSSATKNLVALDLGKSDLLETLGNEKLLPPPTAKLKLTFLILANYLNSQELSSLPHRTTKVKPLLRAT